jgi:iron complex outermembrane receptor protein
MKTWTDTFTQEINISGGNDKLNWIAGMYYMDDKKSRDFIINLPIPAFFPMPGRFEIFQQQNDTESKSAFFDMTYSVSEDMRLGVGFRKTDEDMHEQHSRQIFFTGMPDPIADLCGGIVETIWSDSANTGRVSVEYDTSDDAMVYGSYSEGFKVGGINGNDCNPPWDPETVASYEVGYKATLNDGAATVSAAAFHYDYSDFQVAQVIGIVGIIVNAGDSTIDGFELEVNSNIGDDWTVSAGFTYLDSAYGDFLNTDALQGDAGVLQNKGNPLNKAPKTNLNIGIVRNVTFDSGANLALSLNTAYRSRTYFREFGQLDDSQAAYMVVNLNANFETADELLTGRFFVNNATDEAYITDLSTGDSQYGRHASWGMPRHIGIELTRHFGQR